MTAAEPLSADVLVIGGGIAGLSLAAELAAGHGASVVLVEAEPTLGYHTSSRSARQLIPSYGPQVVQDLTLRTLALIRAAEAGLSQPILTPRSFLLIGDEEAVRDRASTHMHPVMPAEALGLAPELKPGSFEAAGLDTTSVGCNTDALLEYHRSRFLTAGGTVATGRRVDAAARADDGLWTVSAQGNRFSAPVAVNAAGAWADGVAALFGARPLGLTPYRRTAAVVDVERPLDPGAPMVADAADRFYYRPEGSRVLISPAESEPSVPEDARHRQEDVLALIRLVNSVTTMGISGVSKAWTGLRTEAPDGVPAVGWDPAVPGLFWLAGQGGYGFQTSSGIAELAAGIISGTAEENGVSRVLSPARTRM